MSGVPIIITKAYPIEGGQISGMFKIPAEKATKALRIRLIELEGVEAVVSIEPDGGKSEQSSPSERARFHMEKALLALNEMSDDPIQPETPVEASEGGLNASEEETDSLLPDIGDIPFLDESTVHGELMIQPNTFGQHSGYNKGEPA